MVKSVSKRLIPEFREMILNDGYFNFADWQEKLDSKNKQFSISVQENRRTKPSNSSSKVTKEAQRF